MVSTPVYIPPAHPAKGGGQAGRGRPREGGQTRCYAFPGRTEAIASDVVIICIVPVCHRDASVVFDPGSTYLYVSSYFASYLDMSRDSLSTHVYVSTLVGDPIVVDHIYHCCLVTIVGYETRVDFLLFNIVDFDVILGMDWLLPYHAILDYHAKTMTLAMPGLPRLEWRGSFGHVPSRVVYFLKAQRMVEKDVWHT
ncbi:uncharacterized protein [Nicotiana tomentosiformis]|uniref:uncharacterized protein n=1 Tax=Nicotiana tomentosiformis TaxID=4098 RepID=UPI00388C3FB2